MCCTSINTANRIFSQIRKKSTKELKVYSMKRNENAIDFMHWTLTDYQHPKKNTHKKTKEQQTIPNLQTIIMILYTIFWWHKRHLFFKFSIVTANATHSSR